MDFFKKLRPEFTENELKRLTPVIGDITNFLLAEKQKTDFIMVTDQSRIVDQFKENYLRKDEVLVHEILHRDSLYRLFYIWTVDALEQPFSEVLNLKCFSKGMIPERKRLIQNMELRNG